MKLKHLIDPSLRILILPISIILVSLFIIFTLINSVYPGVQIKLSNINEEKKVKNTLDQRLSILKEFKAGVLDDRSDVVYTVFPDKNPGASNLSQIKSLALEDQITITNIEFSQMGTTVNGIGESSITYKYDAKDLPSLLSFLLKIDNIAPITRVTATDVNISPTGVKGTLTASIYWSPLPKDLPALTEPINDLTAAEKMVLTGIYNYRLPQFVNLTPQNQTEERLNPFN